MNLKSAIWIPVVIKLADYAVGRLDSSLVRPEAKVMPIKCYHRHLSMYMAIKVYHVASSVMVEITEVLSQETGKAVDDPLKLIAPILARFMATDRAFTKSRKMRHGASK